MTESTNRHADMTPQYVWVVAASMVDNPHPEVLGVYSNEEAAKKHERAIRSANGTIRGENHDWPVASFWTYEVPVMDGYENEGAVSHAKSCRNTTEGRLYD